MQGGRDRINREKRIKNDVGVAALGEEAFHLHQLGQLGDCRGLQFELFGQAKGGLPGPTVGPCLTSDARGPLFGRG